MPRSVNAGSRSACSKWARFFGLSAAALAAVALGGALAGCVIHDHDDEEWDDEDGSVSPPDNSGDEEEEPRQVSIDTGSAVDATPGEGVGLFVEYAEGGVWRLWASCDTLHSDASCAFDIIVAVDDDSELFSVSAEELEDGDEAGTFDATSGFFRTETRSDVDAVRFETTPGAVLRVDTYLDGEPQPRFVYWVGGNVVHQGAPTNPVDFVPTSP